MEQGKGNPKFAADQLGVEYVISSYGVVNVHHILLVDFEELTERMTLVAIVFLLRKCNCIE